MSTKFGVDSSGRFPVLTRARRQTDRQTRSQTEPITLLHPRIHYRRRGITEIRNWERLSEKRPTAPWVRSVTAHAVQMNGV